MIACTYYIYYRYSSKILDHSLLAVEGFLHRHRDVHQWHLKQAVKVFQIGERGLNHFCAHVLKTTSYNKSMPGW